MCKIDWNLVINFFNALGTIAVAILAIWGDWVKYRFLKPKIIIQPHNLTGVAAQAENALYYHLKVVNRRHWTPAKNCRVALREIHKQLPNSDYKKYPLIIDCSFVWSPRKYTALQANITHEHVFDFLRVDLNNKTVKPVLNFTPQSFEGNIIPNQKIIYALQIVADGFQSDELKFYEVFWDGQLAENLSEMARHLFIKEVKAS